MDNSGAATAGVVGGAVGGGIYAAVAIDNAKKKRIYYELNPFNGELNSSDQTINKVSNESQFTKLILYRRGKKEKETPLNISLNDTLVFQLIPYSWKEFEIPISRKIVKLCFGSNLNQCIELVAITTETKYVEGSISNDNVTNLEQVKIEVGEFYSKQAKYFQEKRENKDKK